MNIFHLWDFLAYFCLIFLCPLLPASVRKSMISPVWRQTSSAKIRSSKFWRVSKSMSWNHMLAVLSFMYKMLCQFLPTHMTRSRFWLNSPLGFIQTQRLRSGLEHTWFIWEGIPESQGERVGREPWKKKNKWPVCCLDSPPEPVVLETLQGLCRSSQNCLCGEWGPYQLSTNWFPTGWRFLLSDLLPTFPGCPALKLRKLHWLSRK